MLYLNKWEKDLGARSSLVLIWLIISLFIIYEYVLVSRLLSDRYCDKAQEYLAKARLTSKKIIVEKSLLYQRALKLLNIASAFNSLDARPHFLYAEAISQIAADNELAMTLEIDNLGVPASDSGELYQLAKLKYKNSIFKEPTNAVYHQRLGSVYEKLHNAQRAEEELKKSLLLDPQNISIHLYLTQYFLSCGKEQDYFYHLYKVVDLYKKSLKGGPLASLVVNFLKDIGREDLIL